MGVAGFLEDEEAAGGHFVGFLLRKIWFVGGWWRGCAVCVALRCGLRGRWSWRCANSKFVQSIGSISQAHGVGMRPLI